MEKSPNELDESPEMQAVRQDIYELAKRMSRDLEQRESRYQKTSSQDIGNQAIKHTFSE